MARKESVTRNDILNAAFLMISEEGLENVTARKLAAKAGCSTQPIFRHYKNMEELQEDLFEELMKYFAQFYQVFPKTENTPFVHLGMVYIKFAEKEKNIFRALFLSSARGGRSLYELLNKNTGAVGESIRAAQAMGCNNPSELFMKMWLFIHGMACMTITGDYDLNADETKALLINAYQSFQ